MAVFRWQGIGSRGEAIQGEMEAATREAVIVRLRGQRIRPLPDRIREKGTGLSREIKIPGLGEKVKPKDVMIFTRQLATMIDAGLPIMQGLDILAQQTPNKTFAKVIKQVKQDVESGSPFAESLKKHPKVFDNLYTNMVAAGEAGGILDTILQRLAIFIEKIVKLKSALRSAMIYPTIILSVAVIVVMIILWKVIPVFRTLFEGFN